MSTVTDPPASEVDAKALRTYGDDIAKLRVEINEVRAHFDSARAARLEIELNTVVDQLMSATGRLRRIPDPAR